VNIDLNQQFSSCCHLV